MDRNFIARELIAVARELTGAVKDLAEIRTIMPEMEKKREEYNRKKEEQLIQMNQMWDNATKDVREKTAQLVDVIQKEVVAHFRKRGMGVRRAGNSGTLMEVFIGDDDGVNRYQSKVSVHIVLTVGRPRASYMLRNENIDETMEGSLADKGTVTKLLQAIKKADKRSFWEFGA